MKALLFPVVIGLCFIQFAIAADQATELPKDLKFYVLDKVSGSDRQTIIDQVGTVLGQRGFVTLTGEPTAAPVVFQYDAMFTNAEFSQAAFLKVGWAVKRKRDYEKLFRLEDGSFVYCGRINKGTPYVVFFGGFEQRDTQLILDKVKSAEAASKIFSDTFLLAQAENTETQCDICQKPISPQILGASAEKNVADITNTQSFILGNPFLSHSWGCLKGALKGTGEGAYGATAGVVTGAISAVKFIGKLGYRAVVDPRKFWNDTKESFGRVVDFIKNFKQVAVGAWDWFSGLSPEEQGKIFCEFLAQMGTGVVVGILVGGVVIPKLFTLIADALAKLERGSSLIASIIQKIKPEKAAVTLNKVANKVKAPKIPKDPALMSEAQLSRAAEDYLPVIKKFGERPGKLSTLDDKASRDIFKEYQEDRSFTTGGSSIKDALRRPWSRGRFYFDRPRYGQEPDYGKWETIYTGSPGTPRPTLHDRTRFFEDSPGRGSLGSQADVTKMIVDIGTKIATKELTANGVQYEITTTPLLKPPYDTVVKIKPMMEGNALNRFAHRLEEKFGVSLTYTPSDKMTQPKGSLAYFSPLEKRISVREVKDLNPSNTFLLHEVRHAWRMQQTEQGVDSLFLGMLDEKPSIKKATPQAYEHYSLDEASTFSHTVRHMLSDVPVTSVERTAALTKTANFAATAEKVTGNAGTQFSSAIDLIGESPSNVYFEFLDVNGQALNQSNAILWGRVQTESATLKVPLLNREFGELFQRSLVSNDPLIRAQAQEELAALFRKRLEKMRDVNTRLHAQFKAVHSAIDEGLGVKSLSEEELLQKTMDFAMKHQNPSAPSAVREFLDSIAPQPTKTVDDETLQKIKAMASELRSMSISLDKP